MSVTLWVQRVRSQGRGLACGSTRFQVQYSQSPFDFNELCIEQAVFFFSIEIFPHKTIVETKEERISRGHPIGHDVPYAAMGGITGFSSLMDGYMRLDDSGIGPPPLHMLEQPVGMQKKKKNCQGLLPS